MIRVIKIDLLKLPAPPVTETGILLGTVVPARAKMIETIEL